VNLDNMIWEAKHGEIEKTSQVLTDEQVAGILDLVGKGCRSNTKEKLARRLKIPLCLWHRFGIYSRMVIEGNEVNYICGQSWTDEMRTLRECILN